MAFQWQPVTRHFIGKVELATYGHQSTTAGEPLIHSSSGTYDSVRFLPLSENCRLYTLLKFTNGPVSGPLSIGRTAATRLPLYR